MTIRQLRLPEGAHPEKRTRSEILAAVRKLVEYHSRGALGGDRMPEDANPGLETSTKDNFHYFTLPMALNYQRNSYRLWEAALATYSDPATRFLFKPEEVVGASEDDVRAALCRYGVALQPNRHTLTWRTICATLARHYQGDVRNLLSASGNDIALILEEVQVTRKRGFPYLSGTKIANYWLYVILQYTSAQLTNRCCLTVAPDTHVIQASIRLGVVEDTGDPNALRPVVAAAWREILAGTDLCPVDIHTPLWLWSRRKFRPDVFRTAP